MLTKFYWRGKLIVFAEFSAKPSLASLLIPPHVQRQNSSGPGASSTGASSSSTSSVVDSTVAAPVSWLQKGQANQTTDKAVPSWYGKKDKLCQIGLLQFTRSILCKYEHWFQSFLSGLPCIKVIAQLKCFSKFKLCESVQSENGLLFLKQFVLNQWHFSICTKVKLYQLWDGTCGLHWSFTRCDVSTSLDNLFGWKQQFGSLYL